MTRILANQKEPNTEISPTNDVTAEERGTGKEETELTRNSNDDESKAMKICAKKKKFTSSTTEKTWDKERRKTSPKVQGTEQDGERTE